MRVCGVDDAGRGPVIGPLVIAGVLVDENSVEALRTLGVKDSKQLSSAARARLAEEIPTIVERYHVEELDAATLDQVVNRAPKFQRLNLLEAKTMARVIERLGPDVAYVDSSDTKTERFRNNILDELKSRPKIISEHHADVTYPVVSAASILAKVRRDSRVEEMRNEFGDFGSGYATDPKTRKFLKDYYRANKGFPTITRRSWKTLRKIMVEVTQTRLE